MEKKRRWDNRSEIEKDGICLSTLVEQFHHLECSNILDKVYGLLGLSCEGHRLEVDYDKSPDTVCKEVLKVVYETQLFDPHARVLFEDILRKVLRLEKIARARATMEDTAGGSGNGRVGYYNKRIYRTSQPVSSKPEFEAGYTSSLFLGDSEALELEYRFGSSWSPESVGEAPSYSASISESYNRAPCCMPSESDYGTEPCMPRSYMPSESNYEQTPRMPSESDYGAEPCVPRSCMPSNSYYEQTPRMPSESDYESYSESNDLEALSWGLRELDLETLSRPSKSKFPGGGRPCENQPSIDH